MFLHNFKYALKILLKDRMLIFWTFAFPIILGTFFQLAFSNIESSEKLEVFDIAIIENENFFNNPVYVNAYKALSDKKQDNQLFNIKYTDKEEALELLENKKIKGYIEFKDTPKIVVYKNGVEETILKYVTEEIIQNEEIINTLIESKMQNQANINMEELYSSIAKILNTDDVKIENITSDNLSFTMIEFYTLIAMACLYGGMFGMVSINNSLANMSNNGKRVSISPTSKAKVVFSSVLASYLTQLIGLAILFIYTIFVLNVNYGSNLLLIILLAIVGSLAGLAQGIFIASVFKTNINFKTGINISVTMLGCFLSGMMGITMKYIVDKNVLLINKLNPASMITDGFYSLYYYDTLNRFYFNVIGLLLFSVILIIVSVLCLRRQKYDSI